MRVGDIKTASQAAETRLEAETAIDANTRARELLGARWRGPETDRLPILKVLEAAFDVDQARLPAAIGLYLYHPERDSRIAQLKTIQGQIDEALESVQENWRNATERGNVDASACAALCLSSTRPILGKTSSHKPSTPYAAENAANAPTTPTLNPPPRSGEAMENVTPLNHKQLVTHQKLPRPANHFTQRRCKTLTAHANLAQNRKA